MLLVGAAAGALSNRFGRRPATLLGRNMDISTADLCDEHPEITRVCEPLFSSYGAKESFGGPIRTARVHEDNVLVRRALDDIEAGSVLVVDGGGSLRCALLGDRLAQVAASRALAGIIVYGCVRDSAGLARTEVGIFALASHPRKSRKNGEGERDVTVEFGGVRFSPGEYVYADADGVIVSGRKLVG